MCSAAEDSDATVCGDEEEEAVHSPSLIGTGANAGLPGLCFLERVGPGPPLDSSRQDRDEGDSVEWEELTVVKRTLQSVKQSLQALQLSLNTKPPQLQGTMGGLKEVSRQLKQAQEGIKACAVSANQERGKQVREVAQELSTRMKELAHLTGLVRGKLSAGVSSSLSSSSLVHDSSTGDELPQSQEIPFQGCSQDHPSIQAPPPSIQAPPPSIQALQNRVGMAVQPTPLVTHTPSPPPPTEPALSQKQTASGSILPTLQVAQAPTTSTALPPVAPNVIVAHMLSAMTSTQSNPTCRQGLQSSCVPSGATSQPASSLHTLGKTSSALSREGGAPGDQRGAPRSRANPSEEGSGSNSAEFAEAVPLQMLIREGLLCPGLSCLSTVIMGVKFVASLNTDSSLTLPTGQAFPQPHLWVNACWEKIGHRNKRTKKGQAYKMVLYQGHPLIHYCQLYNRSKVKSYLQETAAMPKVQQVLPKVPPLPSTQCAQQQQRSLSHPPAASQGRPGDITALLAHFRVVPVKEEEVCPPCYLPAGFWEVSDHVPDVEWFSGDLEWN